MCATFHMQGIYGFYGKKLFPWGHEMLVRHPHPQLLSPRDTDLDWEIFKAAWEQVPDRPLFCYTINIFPETFKRFYHLLVDMFCF